MDPLLLIEWSGADPVVSSPPTVGLAWTLEELEASADDAEDLESARELYDRGGAGASAYPAEVDGEKVLLARCSRECLRVLPCERARPHAVTVTTARRVQPVPQ
jgi:hypothetical protein